MYLITSEGIKQSPGSSKNFRLGWIRGLPELREDIRRKPYQLLTRKERRL